MATATKTKKHRSSQSTPDHYTIRVELLGIRPTIWRRIHLDGRTRLDALHHILQAAMGWSDSHLHKFEIRDKHYGVPDPEFTDPGWEVLDEKKYRLNQLLAEGDSCTYLYDFGDGWQHRITVEHKDKSGAIPDAPFLDDNTVTRDRCHRNDAGQRCDPPVDLDLPVRDIEKEARFFREHPRREFLHHGRPAGAPALDPADKPERLVDRLLARRRIQRRKLVNRIQQELHLPRQDDRHARSGIRRRTAGREQLQDPRERTFLLQ